MSAYMNIRQAQEAHAAGVDRAALLALLSMLEVVVYQLRRVLGVQRATTLLDRPEEAPEEEEEDAAD